MTSLYEWRSLTELEKQARFIYYREFGARMGIDDIPSTRQDLWNWKEEYAKESMVYADSNRQTGEATLELFLRPLPKWSRLFGTQCVYVLTPQLVRKAFGWPSASPAFLEWLVPALLRLRALFVGYLLYPRTLKPGWARTHEIKTAAGKSRIVREGFIFEPWYVASGCSMFGELGFHKPGGTEWRSEGYENDKLGPDSLNESGVEKTRLGAARMREQGLKGCPSYM